VQYKIVHQAQQAVGLHPKKKKHQRFSYSKSVSKVENCINIKHIVMAGRHTLSESNSRKTPFKNSTASLVSSTLYKRTSKIKYLIVFHRKIHVYKRRNIFMKGKRRI
jgi:hypothetical protein